MTLGEAFLEWKFWFSLDFVLGRVERDMESKRFRKLSIFDILRLE